MKGTHGGEHHNFKIGHDFPLCWRESLNESVDYFYSTYLRKFQAIIVETVVVGLDVLQT